MVLSGSQLVGRSTELGIGKTRLLSELAHVIPSLRAGDGGAGGERDVARTVERAVRDRIDRVSRVAR